MAVDLEPAFEVEFSPGEAILPLEVGPGVVGEVRIERFALPVGLISEAFLNDA